MGAARSDVTCPATDDVMVKTVDGAEVATLTVDSVTEPLVTVVDIFKGRCSFLCLSVRKELA